MEFCVVEGFVIVVFGVLLFSQQFYLLFLAFVLITDLSWWPINFDVFESSSKLLLELRRITVLQERLDN